jgi:hypothetical protein
MALALSHLSRAPSQARVSSGGPIPWEPLTKVGERPARSLNVCVNRRNTFIELHQPLQIVRVNGKRAMLKSLEGARAQELRRDIQEDKWRVKGECRWGIHVRTPRGEYRER